MLSLCVYCIITLASIFPATFFLKISLSVKPSIKAFLEFWSYSAAAKSESLLSLAWMAMYLGCTYSLVGLIFGFDKEIYSLCGGVSTNSDDVSWFNMSRLLVELSLVKICIVLSLTSWASGKFKGVFLVGETRLFPYLDSISQVLLCLHSDLQVFLLGYVI